jgi:molecular chaperone GrpE (heat shock protein)
LEKIFDNNLELYKNDYKEIEFAELNCKNKNYRNKILNLEQEISTMEDIINRKNASINNIKQRYEKTLNDIDICNKKIETIIQSDNEKDYQIEKLKNENNVLTNQLKNNEKYETINTK